MAAVPVAALLVSGLAACSSNDDGQAQGVKTLEIATPADSPTGGHTPVGTVVPAPAGKALAVSATQVAALSNDGNTVTIFDRPARGAGRAVSVPALVALVTDSSGNGFLGVGPSGLVRIPAEGAPTTGKDRIEDPLTLTVDGERTLVGTAKGQVIVLDAVGAEVDRIGGFVRVDQITVSPVEVDGVRQVTILDRAQSSLTPIDLSSGDFKAALRAGNGATTAVVDRYGRIVAAGTRDDELLGFYGQPIVMRFRYPVSGSPYALAVDNTRNLLWTSTTGNNEARAFALATGIPEEVGRVETVGQVGSIAVDPKDGDLYLLSARGDGLQVVPAAAVSAAAK